LHGLVLEAQVWGSFQAYSAELLALPEGSLAWVRQLQRVGLRGFFRLWVRQFQEVFWDAPQEVLVLQRRPVGPSLPVTLL